MKSRSRFALAAAALLLVAPVATPALAVTVDQPFPVVAETPTGVETRIVSLSVPLTGKVNSARYTQALKTAISYIRTNKVETISLTLTQPKSITDRQIDATSNVSGRFLTTLMERTGVTLNSLTVTPGITKAVTVTITY